MRFVWRITQPRFDVLRAILGHVRRIWFVAVGLTPILWAIGQWRDEAPPGKQPPLAAEVLTWLPWWAWVSIALAITSIALFEGAYREIQHLKTSPVVSPQPNLKLLNCEAKERQWLSYPEGTPLYTLSLATAQFANEPTLLAPEAAASNVVAYVEYFDSGRGTRVLNMALYGRWQQVPLPATLPIHASLDPLYPIDFPVTGITRDLCVALKFPEDDDCYAWDNFIMRGNLRKVEYRLVGGTFKVRITLVAVGVNREFWLTLHNRGRGAGLEIEAEGRA